MKKFLALALVVIMILAFAVPAFAESQIQITYDPQSKYETYSIVVPVELYVDGAAGQITANEYDLNSKNCLMVSVVSNYKFDEIESAFAIKVNGGNDTVAYFEAAEESADIAAVSTENTPSAGTYQGLITYLCAIVNKGDI